MGRPEGPDKARGQAIRANVTLVLQESLGKRSMALERPRHAATEIGAPSARGLRHAPALPLRRVRRRRGLAQGPRRDRRAPCDRRASLMSDRGAECTRCCASPQTHGTLHDGNWRQRAAPRGPRGAARRGRRHLGIPPGRQGHSLRRAIRKEATPHQAQGAPLRPAPPGGASPPRRGASCPTGRACQGRECRGRACRAS